MLGKYGKMCPEGGFRQKVNVSEIVLEGCQINTSDKGVQQGLMKS